MLLILIFGRGLQVSVAWILEGSLPGGHDVLRFREWVGVNQKIFDIKSSTFVLVCIVEGFCLWNTHRRLEIAKQAISS